jgi:hypothetical protein
MIPFVVVDQNSRRIRKLLGFRDVEPTEDAIVPVVVPTIEDPIAVTASTASALTSGAGTLRKAELPNQEIVLVLDIADREPAFAVDQLSSTEGVVWNSHA